MKKLFTLIVTAIIFFGCGSLDSWEYKVVRILPMDDNARTGPNAISVKIISISERELNKLGSEGWELVDSYLEMETAYPNFGKEEYHTGIKINVRPQLAVLIFKRPWQAKKDDK